LTLQGENPNKAWVIMEIPLGTVKNIKVHMLEIQDLVLKTMQQLYSEGIGLFSSVIKATSFFNNNSGGPPVNWDITNQVREDISKAFIENDFRVFTGSFLPRKGGHLGFSNETRVYLENFLCKWRLKNMGFDEGNFKMLKSAGKTIAVASRSHQSLLYKLDKAKDKTTLLDALRQVSRRIVGLKPEEKEKYKGYIYPPSLEELVILLETHCSDRKYIEDLRNTLIIFSCVELSRLDYFGGIKGGEEK